MFHRHRKTSKNCQSLAGLTQNVEGLHLSHRNGPTLSIKHVSQRLHHPLPVLHLKPHLAEGVKVVCNKLLSISIAHLIYPILDTLVLHQWILENLGIVKIVGIQHRN